MRRWQFCALLAILAFTVGIARAYPTLTGPTGLAFIPTARVCTQSITLAADWTDLPAGHAVPIRLLTPLGYRSELGIMVDPMSQDAPLSLAWGVNAKVGLLPVLGGDTAFGFQWRREEDHAGFDTDFTQAYLVWSHYYLSGCGVLPLFDLTAGVHWTLAQPEVGAKESVVRVFGGVQVVPVRKFALLAEVQSKSSRLGDSDVAAALTVRYLPSPWFAAQIGVTNAFGMLGSSNYHLFGGISLAFDIGGSQCVYESPCVIAPPK